MARGKAVSLISYKHRGILLVEFRRVQTICVQLRDKHPLGHELLYRGCRSRITARLNPQFADPLLIRRSTTQLTRRHASSPHIPPLRATDGAFERDVINS